MSRPEDSEQAEVLARKAGEDAKAARLLAGNEEISDEIVGFHAQQAVEKWLKAVMAARGLPENRIHDIGRLLQILKRGGIALPTNADRLDELTEYAVPMRYDELLDAEPLDREAAMSLVSDVEKWAIDQLGSVVE